jgi:hypothetical protein
VVDGAGAWRGGALERAGVVVEGRDAGAFPDPAGFFAAGAFGVVAAGVDRAVVSGCLGLNRPTGSLRSVAYPRSTTFAATVATAAMTRMPATRARRSLGPLSMDEG